MSRKKQQKNGPRNVRSTVALILSGGAARGLAHVGVISVLEEHKIPVDIVVGASFGSIVAGYYGYGYSIDQMLEFAQKFKLWSLRDFRLPWRSFLNGDKEEGIFDQDLGKIKIEDLKLPVVILAADLMKKREVIFDRGSLSAAMRASSAFPGLFDPYSIGEQLLIDGGIMDDVPVKVARERGADIVISSDVSILSRIYKKKVANFLFKILLNRVSKRGPLVPRATLTSIIRNTLSIIAKYHEDKSEAPDFLIEPLEGEIKPLHFRKVEEGFHLGRIAALGIIEDIVRRVYG
ncbi:MAG: patatin-like phospholipase family protein [Spirochaetota bacterium]|nr:MAG: patatin-like phospholipase family protein [Spirochaetota bacterium]